jgi:aminopeptidase N
MRSIYLLIIFVSLSNNFFSQVNKEPVYYNDSSIYDVKYYKLNIYANTDSLYISGNTYLIATVVKHDLSKFYIELSSSLAIDSILINNNPFSFVHQDNWIKVDLLQPIPEGNSFTVSVYYKGYAATSSSFGGIALDSYDNVKILYTLSEPFSALDFFACKQFLTDKADSVTIILNVPLGLTGIANGLLRSIDTIPGNQVSFRWESRYPIAYYLIAIAVANYKEYSYRFYDKSCGDSVLFQNFYYNTPNYLTNQKNNIDKTVKIIELYEKITGVSFPFHKEKYGHVTAPIGGGMENQTITMVDGFDFDLVAHELAHSWFGDMVTCSDWQNIWINEGFASYFEYFAFENLDTVNSKIWLQNCFKFAIRNSNNSVFITEDDKWNEQRLFSYFDTYRKGAAVIHMLRHKIRNDSIFLKIINTFLTKYTYSNASTEDFKTVAESVSKIDLENFFNQWYYGKGYPVINIEGNAALRKLSLTLNVTSSSTENSFTDIALEIRVKFKSIPDSLITLDISKSAQSYDLRFNDVVTAVIVNPNYALLASISSVIDIDSTSVTKAFVTPNPFSDHLVIDFPDTGKLKSVKLFDTNGKSVGEWESPNITLNIWVKNLIAGPYVLLANDGASSYNFKIVKIN